MKNLPAILVVLILILSTSGCFENEDTNGEDLPPEAQEAKESAPGDLAKAFLQSENYTNLVIEVDYISTLKPSSTALSLLKQRDASLLSQAGKYTFQSLMPKEKLLQEIRLFWKN